MRYGRLSFLCFALICVFSAVIHAQAVRAPAAPSTDFAFKLKGVDGKTYESARMKGDVLLVSYGATWCSPCAAELTALEELKQEYQGKPVRFLWVSIEASDEASDSELRRFANDLKMTIPVLRDPLQTTYTQFTTRKRLPMVIFYDKSGRISPPAHFGMASPEMYKDRMRLRLDLLLSQSDKR